MPGFFRWTVAVTLISLLPMTAVASGCRGVTPKLKKAILDFEAQGFSCDPPQLTIDASQVDTAEKKQIYEIYKDTLMYLVHSTDNGNVSHVGANFEYAYYKNGPVFLDGFPQPVSLRVSQDRINFTHQELTLCTHFDPNTNILKSAEVEAEIAVKGVVGLTGVCRNEKRVSVSAPTVSP